MVNNNFRSAEGDDTYRAFSVDMGSIVVSAVCDVPSGLSQKEVGPNPHSVLLRRRDHHGRFMGVM